MVSMERKARKPKYWSNSNIISVLRYKNTYFFECHHLGLRYFIKQTQKIIETYKNDFF